MAGLVISQLSSMASSLQNRQIGSYFSNVKPVSEFLAFKRVSNPQDFATVTSRLSYNLGEFSGNYVIVFLCLAFYSIITNASLLFAILFFGVGLGALKYLERAEGVVSLRESTISQLYTFVYIAGIFLVLYASPITTMLWLIGASGITILTHAALLEKPIDEAFAGDVV